MNSRDNFKKNLDRLMRERRCMQTDIANYLGTSKGMVSTWVLGRAFPRPDMLDKLAEYFGVSPFELICEYDSDETSLLRYFRRMPKGQKAKALQVMDTMSKYEVSIVTRNTLKI